MQDDGQGKSRRGAMKRGNDQVRRRLEGQRLRPSSKASREAAASRTTSDCSQPPFGTVKRVGGGQRHCWVGNHAAK
jgi:hypothetical protein